jgi:hypothetical protein
MAKKQIDEDDDFENDFENDDNDVVDYQDDNSDDEVSDDDGDILDIEDDGDIDIVIEIDEDDLDLIDSENEVIADEETTESGDDIILSKHKIEGKHSLKYDSIFKGKKEDPVSEDDMDGFAAYYKETIEVDKSSIYHHESIDNETYVRGKLVKERVYQVLKENTTINFLNNRRKPSRVDFNCYYSLLKENLKEESFTNIELFNELAVYFSDNLFNMFKLLDNSWRNLIINELQDHIGKNKNSKEITNRNIYIGTEIEFVWYDDIVEEEKLITGVVLETIYEESIFKVDSFEKIYMVEISDITKILNNTKFKYNLNKLNNIDFL